MMPEVFCGKCEVKMDEYQIQLEPNTWRTFKIGFHCSKCGCCVIVDMSEEIIAEIEADI